MALLTKSIKTVEKNSVMIFRSVFWVFTMCHLGGIHSKYIIWEYNNSRLFIKHLLICQVLCLALKVFITSPVLQNRELSQISWLSNLKKRLESGGGRLQTQRTGSTAMLHKYQLHSVHTPVSFVLTTRKNVV